MPTGMSSGWDTVWECVIPYVENQRDREAVSLTCKRWYELDSITRKHLALFHAASASPFQLSKRFPNLESFHLSANSSTSPGNATPWVEEIAKSLAKVKAVTFGRMIVKDSDLELLSRTRGSILELLNLDECSGFSTDGLLHVARACRDLKIFSMEKSKIVQNDWEWLHELALNNTVLQHLNFYKTGLTDVSFEDLDLILKNCASLVCMKTNDTDIMQLLFIWNVVIPDFREAGIIR